MSRRITPTPLTLQPAATRAAAASLRVATASDLSAIEAIERASFDRPAERFHRAQIRYLLSRARGQALVATRGAGGQVLGWSLGLVRRGAHGVTGRLYAVAVLPETRGQGLGRLLVRGTLRYLSTQGARRVYLEVRQDNAAAVALYRQLGFVPGRSLPDYYGRGRHGLNMVSGSRSGMARQTPSPARRAVARRLQCRHA